MKKTINIGIITYNRSDILKKNLTYLIQFKHLYKKIFIVNNGSIDRTKSMLNILSQKYNFIKSINLDNNKGVSSRNIIFNESDSDFLIFIDDDAIINDFQKSINSILKNFHKDLKLGVMQYKIIDNQSNKVLKREFPFKYSNTNLDQPHEISYFIGAGFVIRKQIYKKIFFDENFFYGQEETDLSYRIIKEGYTMKYDPNLNLQHYRDQNGRLKPKEVIINNYYYRIVMNYKYLPVYITIISNFLWFLKTWRDSRSFFISLKTITRFYFKKESKNYKKSKLNLKQLHYIYKTNGRLFY